MTGTWVGTFPASSRERLSSLSSLKTDFSELGTYYKALKGSVHFLVLFSCGPRLQYKGPFGTQAMNTHTYLKCSDSQINILLPFEDLYILTRDPEFSLCTGSYKLGSVLLATVDCNVHEITVIHLSQT